MQESGWVQVRALPADGHVQVWAGGAAGVAMGSWAGRQALAQQARPGKLAALPGAKSGVAGAVTMEKVTDYKDTTTYNNYYEFGTDKADPAKTAHTLKTSPWVVEIEGMVKKPAKYTLEDMLKLSAQEERMIGQGHTRMAQSS